MPCPTPSRLSPALAASLLAAALGVAGCSSENHFPPACPALALLPDAADLTQYSAAGQDITDLEVDARITAVPAVCRPDPDSPNKVAAQLRVAMAVTRGPAATGRAFQLPYFVAVTRDGRIADKQDYVMQVRFPSNTNLSLVASDPIDLIVPVTKDKSAAAYSIYVGYVLTPDELALNRKRGPR